MKEELKRRLIALEYARNELQNFKRENWTELSKCGLLNSIVETITTAQFSITQLKNTINEMEDCNEYGN